MRGLKTAPFMALKSFGRFLLQSLRRTSSISLQETAGVCPEPFDYAQGSEPFDFAQDSELAELLVELFIELRNRRISPRSFI
jgi:hypothetical protein